MDKILEKIRAIVKNLTSKSLEANLKSLPVVKSLYAPILDGLQDKDKQSENLTKAYIGAFCIIAAISVLGHLVTVHSTDSQRDNAEITFTMTNLRSLVDSIVSQASTFKTSGNSFDDELLTQSIDHLQKEQTKIETYGSSAMNRVFHDTNFLLAEKLKSFISIADTFAKYKRTGKVMETTAAFTALSGETSRSLEINLDLALEKYRSDVMSQIAWSYNLQFIGVITILLVLALEAAFIFRPLVHRLGEYHKHLLKLALTDVLTGLNNRRAFMQLALEGIDYYKRHKTPYALVLMDLDHFKTVNDTYGHKVGDLVLQHYAELMQKSLRAYDTLGRIGGEEFAIFLPRTTAEEAMTMIERFRKRVAETPCSYVDGSGQSKTLNYSSSFGIVSVTQDEWTLDNLLIRADEELYKAKEQGRNRVVLKQL